MSTLRKIERKVKKAVKAILGGETQTNVDLIISDVVADISQIDTTPEHVADELRKYAPKVKGLLGFATKVLAELGVKL